MKKAEKGTFGYIKYEKIKRAVITLIMFAIPLAIYFTGLQQTGTRKNLFTLVAILGVLPAAKFAVSLIMMLMQRSADPEIVKQTEHRAGDLTRAYELVISAYEGTMPIDAMVLCGNEIMCFSSQGKKDKFSFMEKHMAKILNGNQYYSANVKIFSDAKPYLDRVSQLAADPEKYREGVMDARGQEDSSLTREERMKQVLMAISL